MEWCPVAVLLVHSVVASNDANFLKYRKYGESFVTLKEDSEGHLRRDPEANRRFLTFHNDKNSIEVEIEFSVPLLKIPLGKGISGAINVNAKPLLLASTLFFAAVLLVPKFLQYFLPKVIALQKGRGSDECEGEDLVRGLETALQVNVTACWQQRVCSLVRASRDNPSIATPWARVLDGLASMSWVTAVSQGTALGEAFAAAGGGRGCEELNSRCLRGEGGGGSFPHHLARHYMHQLTQRTADYTYQKTNDESNTSLR